MGWFLKGKNYHLINPCRIFVTQQIILCCVMELTSSLKKKKGNKMQMIAPQTPTLVSLWKSCRHSLFLQVQPDGVLTFLPFLSPKPSSFSSTVSINIELPYCTQITSFSHLVAVGDFSLTWCYNRQLCFSLPTEGTLANGYISTDLHNRPNCMGLQCSGGRLITSCFVWKCTLII